MIDTESLSARAYLCGVKAQCTALNIRDYSSVRRGDDRNYAQKKYRTPALETRFQNGSGNGQIEGGG